MPIMPYSRKPALNYFMYSFFAVIMAVIYFLFTYFGIYARGTEGFALRTYIWNLVMIVVVLFSERIYLARLKKRKVGTERAKVLHFVSFKASLYLFYTFVLITSRLMLLTELEEIGRVGRLYGFREYILSIEYGLILLVAVDKFIDQFIKDKKHTIEIAERQSHREGA